LCWLVKTLMLHWTSWRKKKRWLRDRERQIAPKPFVSAKPESSRLSIEQAVEQYFKNLHSQGKDPKTIRAYKVSVEEFRQSCPKKFLDEIGRQDLIDFMGWLRQQPPKLRKNGIPRKVRRSGDHRACPRGGRPASQPHSTIRSPMRNSMHIYVRFDGLENTAFYLAWNTVNWLPRVDLGR
jgi:hypothetical protein